MQQTQTLTRPAPAIAGEIVRFRLSGDLPPYAIVENLNATASASIRWQQSSSGSDGSFTDIVDTHATIGPKSSNGQSIVASQPYIRLFGSGNVDLLITLVRQFNGDVSDLN